MTLLQHLNHAREELSDAYAVAAFAYDRVKIQTMLDTLDNMIATEEALDRRDQEEKRTS